MDFKVPLTQLLGRPYWAWLFSGTGSSLSPSSYLYSYTAWMVSISINGYYTHSFAFIWNCKSVEVVTVADVVGYVPTRAKVLESKKDSYANSPERHFKIVGGLNIACLSEDPHIIRDRHLQAGSQFKDKPRFAIFRTSEGPRSVF